jgi:hypothetical protein
MGLTMDEYLAEKNNSNIALREISCQWKLKEEEFKKQNSVLWERRRALEQAERDLHYLEDSEYRKVEERSKEISSKIDAEKSLLLKQISLVSLKHCLPVGFKKERDFRYPVSIKEEVLFETPLVKIIAVYFNGDKPVNKIEYQVGIYSTEQYNRAINRLMGISKELDQYHDGNDLILTSKSFKTIEDAERYNNKNKERIIKNYISRIEDFNSLVQSANDDFESVFDFRLIERKELRGQRNHYQILEKEENKLVISSENYDYVNKEDRGTFVVTLVGWDFIITPNSGTKEPNYIQLSDILSSLSLDLFELPHMFKVVNEIDILAREISQERSKREWIKNEYDRLKNVPKDQWYVGWSNREKLIRDIEEQEESNNQ